MGLWLVNLIQAGNIQIKGGFGEFLATYDTGTLLRPGTGVLQTMKAGLGMLCRKLVVKEGGVEMIPRSPSP